MPKTTQTIEIKQEDILTCDDCPKADVCTVIRSIAAQYEANKVLIEKVKEEFSVELNIKLTANITKCPHKPELTLI
jgi:uncharacterized surface anchored protein